MMNNNDNKDIKFTGDPVAFDGVEGKRDPKTGKGRFDLIPEEVFEPLFDRVHKLETTEPYDINFAPDSILEDIANEKWLDAIIKMTILSYGSITSVLEAFGQTTNPSAFFTGCWNMFLDLAIHFQKGAEHYGERNCQKGIPLWSFKDSAMRHAAQAFAGKTDEPHIISVIWNCWMAEWTVLHEKTTEKLGPYTVKVLKARTPEEIEAAKSATSTPELKAMKLQSALKEVREAGYVVIQPTSTLDTNELINYVSELLIKKHRELKKRMYTYDSNTPEYRVYNNEQLKLKNVINAIFAAYVDETEPGTVMVAKDKLEDMKPIIEELKNIAEEYNTPIITAQQKYYTIEEVKAIKKEVADRVANENLGRWLVDRSNLPLIFKMISTIDLFNELIKRIKNIDGPTMWMPEYRKLTILLNDAMLKYGSSDDNKTEE